MDAIITGTTEAAADAAVAEHGTAGMAVDATDIDVMDVEHGRTAMAVSVVQTGVHATLLQRYQRL